MRGVGARQLPRDPHPHQGPAELGPADDHLAVVVLGEAAHRLQPQTLLARDPAEAGAVVGDLDRHRASALQHPQLDMTVGAMGQQVDAQIDVEDRYVRCNLQLPAMLAMLAKPIEAMLRSKGGDLLLEDKSK